MAVSIVQASHDENGAYRGGAAGDQTGQEVRISAWYDRPWDFIARPLHCHVAAAIASAALAIAYCDRIGYDQNERTSLYKECEKIGWNMPRLNEIGLCECDCSSLISVILRFCGIEMPATVNTMTLEYYLRKSGNFEIIADAAFISSSDALRAGDILVNRLHHAAVAVTNGPKASTQCRYIGRNTVKDIPDNYLQVRQSPESLTYNEYIAGKCSLRLPPGMEVIITEERDGWGKLSGFNGWVYLEYIEKVTDI